MWSYIITHKLIVEDARKGVTPAENQQHRPRILMPERARQVIRKMRITPPGAGREAQEQQVGGGHVSSSVIAENVVYRSGMVANPAARGQIEQRGKRGGVLSSRNRSCRRNGVNTVLLVDAEQDQQREDGNYEAERGLE